MAMLYTKVKLYLEANSKTWEAERKNIFLQDDMVDGVSNPYIKEWNVSGLSKPTDDQIASYEDAANTKEERSEKVHQLSPGHVCIYDYIK